MIRMGVAMRVFCATFYACGWLAMASAAASADDDWPRGQLPRVVTPTAYRLNLEIVPDQPRFAGKVEIDVEVAEPVSGFWLHGNGLDVTEAIVITADGAVFAGQYTQRSDDGVAWLELDGDLPAGSAMLAIEYVAAFDRGLTGLYKVSVGDDSYAFTQFESVWARKAFPGFDEPAFKTPFSTTVTTRDEYRALSNTRVIKREDLPDGRKRLTYATTEPLPTYLIAFAVGALDVVEFDPIPENDQRAAPLQLRGVAARGQGARLQFALANTAPLVDALENYFGLAYPYDKLDIVAVPDFAGGAMENAGLITYRESILLFDENSPVNLRRYFGLIHAHEIAHHWFGNLVTMPWWDDIWLNEAFASWIQSKAAQEWRPDFRYEQSVQAQALRAMASDSLVSARQIREPVESYDDILSAFDSITYQKGAAVLQMFERYLGETVFRDGIQAHMTRFAHGSATVFDLLDSLESVAGESQPVREPFESFLFQPGLPYISVQTYCTRAGVEVRLAQQRYLPVGSSGSREQTWQLPVCLAFSKGDNRDEHCLLLTDAEQSFMLEKQACPDHVIPNAGGAGYYRWLIPAGMDELGEVLLTAMDAGERLSYVDSSIAGIAAGVIPPAVFLSGLPDIAMTPERFPVTATLTAYQQMLSFLVADDQRVAANELGRNAFAPRLDALRAGGAALSDSDRRLLDASLTDMMALWLMDAPTRQVLQEAAANYLGYPSGSGADAAALDPDQLRTALTVAVQDGDVVFTRFLIEYVRNSKDSRVRLDAVAALAHADDEAKQELARELAFGGDLRNNEFQTWAAHLFNPASRDANWAWLQENLVDFMAVASRRARREMPLYASRGLCSNRDAQTLRNLFDDLPAEYPVSARVLNQAVETVELCAAFRAAQAGAVNAYLAAQ
ncbi:MAG: M1 family aminopeptidase [Gammaproteobacteria bacterium]|nr:M1 family aminopeptidase [Gammaproteobacteria bacterium]